MSKGTETKEIDFGAGLRGFLKNVAALCVSISVVFGAIWVGAKPYVDDYLEAFVQPLKDVLEAHGDRLLIIEENLDLVQDRVSARIPFIEFKGRGIVVYDKPYKPGEVVPIDFFLKRNLACSTTVVVQFHDAQRGRVLSSFTSEIPSTPAPSSFTFIPFTVDLRIPESLPDGRYSYRAILKPDKTECPGQTDVHTPPSTFFTVER